MGNLSEEVRTEVLFGRICDLESENARLQEQIKQFQAENARLRELFYEAWDWMQHVRYDKYIQMEKLCNEPDGYVEKEES